MEFHQSNGGLGMRQKGMIAMRMIMMYEKESVVSFPLPRFPLYYTPFLKVNLRALAIQTFRTNLDVFSTN